MSCSEMHQRYKMGFQDGKELQQARTRYGDAIIDVPLKSIPELLVTEVLNPFYIFQIAAMALYFWDEYVYYAWAILIVSVISVITSLYETR